MPVKLRLFLFAFSFLLIAHFQSSGQILEEINTSLKTKPKFFLNLSSFNTFIDGDFASFDGIETGITFNKKVRFGVGYFALANNGVVTTISVQEGTNTFETNGQLELYYFNLTAEYFFYHEFPWQFSVVPFNVAVGSGHYEYVSHASGKRVNGPSELIVVYQPEVTAQYNVLTWFGFGVSTGYRFTLYRSKEQTKALPGFNFSLDFRLSLDELYYELRSGK